MTVKKWENRIVCDASVSPAELKPNPSNWRRHPEKQRLALEGLLGEVGWVGRVLVNLTTGYIDEIHTLSFPPDCHLCAGVLGGG